ncbi:hypothetical protein D9757_013325 [Collybiopsis confluens]|uniref:Uncharacterized protein n=1 Tax=Collybiopsis confluens TaxID=2823264 RepID=A0A8H5G371_9AGAR|nr:hypothetical protein D9757_013325 [Collybiopsis confluens]
MPVSSEDVVKWTIETDWRDLPSSNDGELPSDLKAGLPAFLATEPSKEIRDLVHTFVGPPDRSMLKKWLHGLQIGRAQVEEEMDLDADIRSIDEHPVRKSGIAKHVSKSGLPLKKPRSENVRGQVPITKPPQRPESERSAARGHSCAKQQLWAMLLSKRILHCVFTWDTHPLESAHVIQRKCPYTTRVRIYKAVGGWFCEHSRLNIMPLISPLHTKWDDHMLVFFLKDLDALEAVDEYLNFLNDRDPAQPAYDWLSLLRKRHPILCEGNTFDIGMTCYQYAPLCTLTRILKAQADSYETFNVTKSVVDARTYVHPLFILVRLMETLDHHLETTDWRGKTRSADEVLAMSREAWPNIPDIFRKNIEVVRKLSERMGPEVVLWEVPPGAKTKATSFLASDGGASGNGGGGGGGEGRDEAGRTGRSKKGGMLNLFRKGGDENRDSRRGGNSTSRSEDIALAWRRKQMAHSAITKTDNLLRSVFGLSSKGNVFFY